MVMMMDCECTCCGKLVLFIKRMRIELMYNSAIPLGLCPPSYEKQGLANSQYIGVDEWLGP